MNSTAWTQFQLPTQERREEKGERREERGETLRIN